MMDLSSKQTQNGAFVGKLIEISLDIITLTIMVDIKPLEMNR